MAIQIDVSVNGNAAKDLDGISSNLKVLQANYDNVKTKIDVVNDGIKNAQKAMQDYTNSAKESSGQAKRNYQEEADASKIKVEILKEELAVLKSLDAYRDGSKLEKYNTALREGTMTTEAHSAAINKLADAHISNNGKVDESVTAHERLTGGFRNALITFDAAVVAVYAIKSAYDATIGSIVDFSAKMEMNRLSVAAIITANTANVDSTGKVIDATTKMNLALKDSDAIMVKLQGAQRETHSTMGEMSSMFTQLSGAALKLGMSYEQVIKLSVDFMNAGKVFDPTQTAMIPRMASEILNGTASSRDPLNQYLQIDQKHLESLKTANEQFKYLEEKLSSVAEVARRTQDTFMGLTSNVVGDFQIISSQAFKPIFEEMKGGLKTIDDALWNNKNTITSTLVAGTSDAAAAFRALKQDIAPVTDVLGAWGKLTFTELKDGLGAVSTVIGGISSFALSVVDSVKYFAHALSGFASTDAGKMLGLYGVKNLVGIAGNALTPEKEKPIVDASGYSSASDFSTETNTNIALVQTIGLSKKAVEELDKIDKRTEKKHDPLKEDKSLLEETQKYYDSLQKTYDGSAAMSEKLAATYKNIQNIKIDMAGIEAKTNKKGEGEAKRHADAIAAIMADNLSQKAQLAEYQGGDSSASIAAKYDKEYEAAVKNRDKELKDTLNTAKDKELIWDDFTNKVNLIGEKEYKDFADREKKKQDILSKYYGEAIFPDELSKSLYAAAMEYNKDYEKLKGNLENEAALWEAYVGKTDAIRKKDADNKQKLSDEWAIKLLDENRKLSDSMLAETDKMYGSNDGDKIDRWYTNQVDQLNKFSLSLKDVTGHEAEINALYETLLKIKNLKLEQTTLSFKLEDTFFKSFESTLAGSIESAFNGHLNFSTFFKSIEQAMLKTLAGSLAGSTTDVLRGTQTGGSGLSIDNLVSGGKAAYNIYTGEGLSAATADNIAIGGYQASASLGFSETTAGSIGTGLADVASGLAAFAPYLAIGALAIPLLVSAIGGGTSTIGSGVKVFSPLSSNSSAAGSFYNYTDTQYSNAFHSSDKENLSVPNSAVIATINNALQGYSTLLKQLGASVTEIQVEAGKYTSDYLMNTLLPKDFFKDLMSSASAPADNASVQEVYDSWAAYATSIQSTVGSAVSSVFGEDSKTLSAIKELNYNAQGIDGAASVAIESASGTQQQMLKALSSAIDGVSGLGFSAADVTVSNFQEMHDKLLATNPTPAMIQAFDAYGNALVTLSKAVTTNAGKILSASATSAVTSATTPTIAYKETADYSKDESGGTWFHKNADGTRTSVDPSTIAEIQVNKAPILPTVAAATGGSTMPSTGAATGGTGGSGGSSGSSFNPASALTAVDTFADVATKSTASITQAYGTIVADSAKALTGTAEEVSLLNKEVTKTSSILQAYTSANNTLDAYLNDNGQKAFFQTDSQKHADAKSILSKYGVTDTTNAALTRDRDGFYYLNGKLIESAYDATKLSAAFTLVDTGIKTSADSIVQAVKSLQNSITATLGYTQNLIGGYNTTAQNNSWFNIKGGAVAMQYDKDLAKWANDPSRNDPTAAKELYATYDTALKNWVTALNQAKDSLESFRKSMQTSIQNTEFDLYASGVNTKAGNPYAKYSGSVITVDQIDAAIKKTTNETDITKITQDATDAQTITNTYLQQQTTLINNSYQTQVAMLQILTSLKDFAKQMWLADYSYLNSTQKANVAQGYYVSDMAKLTTAINNKDTANATKYSTAVQTDIPNYLKNLQTSGTDINSYKFAFDSVASQMTAVNNSITDSGDTVESLTKKQTDAINDLKDKSIGKLQDIYSAIGYQETGITTKLSEVAKALNITYTAPTINVYVDGSLKTTQVGQSTTTFSGSGSALQTAQSTSNAVTPSQALANYKSAYTKDMGLWRTTPNKSLADEMRWLAQQIENQAKTNGITGYDGYYQSVDSWFNGKNYATGGFVIGAGTGTSDSINAKLSNGEYVATEQQVKQYPQLFSWLNQNRGYATGGMVNDVPLTAYPSEMEAKIVKLIDLTQTQNIILSQINNRQKRYENENGKAMSVTNVS